MHRPSCSTTSFIVYIMIVIEHIPAVFAATQCFGINGQKSAAAPCNSDVTGSGSSHSACCDESKQEACLSSGLCYATQRGDNNTFWAEGCTDPMGRDPTCPSYCGATSQFISNLVPVQPSYTMLFCGEAKWCCCFDNFGMACNKTECCSRNFTIPQGLGTVVRQFDNAGDNTGNNNDNDNDNGRDCWSRGEGGDCNGWDGRERGMRIIPIVVAGILASLLFATIVAFGFSCTQNRRLRRQVDTLQGINANLKTYSTSTSSTVSSRPSVHSIQPLVHFNYPSYQPDEATPSTDSYHAAGGGNTLRTNTNNPGYHPSNSSDYYHHQSMAGYPLHEPQTPSTVGPPPGYGFPHPPMPPQLSGRRPSLPRTGADTSLEMQYATVIPPPPQQQQQPMPGSGMRALISELPTEKNQR